MQRDKKINGLREKELTWLSMVIIYGWKDKWKLTEKNGLQKVKGWISSGILITFNLREILLAEKWMSGLQERGLLL